MKELILNDGRKTEVQKVITDNKIIYIRVILKTSEELKALFADEFATSVMSLMEYGKEIARYENYTLLKYLKEEAGGIWEIALQKKEADTEERLKELEQASNKQEKEIEKMKEDMESGTDVDTALFQAAIVVARANAQSLPDQEAVEAKAIYHTWQELVAMSYTAVAKGYKFTHGNLLYKTIKENQKFEAQWVPGQGTESLFVRIDETHAGTKEDPIPWTPNMQPEEGKCYKEGELVARCIEDPGQALYNRLSELCPGRYFAAAE